MNDSAEGAGAAGSVIRLWRQRRGMSQLDLAIAAATTQRHVSFVEQGRSTPGRTMLLRLAESMSMPLDARNALLLTAGYSPVFSTATLDSIELAAVRDSLRRVLDGFGSYPAIVVDRVGDIVLANRAADLLVDGADAELRREPVNAYRLALHPHGLAPRIRNFPAWSQHVLRNLRDAAHRTGNDQLERLVGELSSYAPAVAPGTDHVAFAVPLELESRLGALRLITTMMTFSTSDNVPLSEVRLEAFLPADADTSTRLDALAGDPPPSDSTSTTRPEPFGLGSRIQQRFSADGGVDLDLPDRTELRREPDLP